MFHVFDHRSKKPTSPRLLNLATPAMWGWGVSVVLHAGVGAILLLGVNDREHQRPRSLGARSGITLEVTLRGSRPQNGDANQDMPEILIPVTPPSLPFETAQRVHRSLAHVAVKQSTPIATRSNLTNSKVAPPKRPPETPQIDASVTEPRPRQLATIAAPQVVVVAPESVGTDADQPPTPWANRPPLYPDQAIMERREGIVQLRITISTSGKVTNVEVARSSTHSILDGAAVRAARSWRFEPAKVNGIAVETVETQEIRFELRD